MPLTIDLVRRGARRWGERPAVQHGGRTLSFRAVDQLSNRMANTLIAAGLQPQDRVALLVDNGLYSIPLDFACLKARAVRVPLNVRLAEAEHHAMLAQATPRLLVTSEALLDRAQALADAVEGCAVLTLGGGGSDDLLERVERASDADPMLATPPDDVVLALFTSGTTGTLKAAQHTQASYAAIVANILANLVSPTRDDAMIHAASLVHASGTFVLPFWLRGGRSVVLDRFAPASFLTDARASGATHTNLVPTMLQMLLEAGDTNLGPLRSIVYGASPMPRPTIEQALDRLGPVFTQYYGQTEAPLALAILQAVDHVGPDAPLSACGQPAVDVSLNLVDDAGAPVADGEVGEIAVAGPMVHAGYLGAPELNLEARLPGGGWRTRDLGRLDERGFLHLVDRTSDMIVTGGYNVYPREVEDALAAHPAIIECAVVGTPDAKWVEAVVAVVVARDSVSDEALCDWVRARLAGHKVPKRIIRADTLPKSAVGKVLRRALREQLREEA